MAVKEVLRSYGSLDRDVNSNVGALCCEDVSRAIQSQRDEADINVIVRNFGITGVVPQNVRVPMYGDFDVVNDYQTAIEAVRSAEASFMQMSAEVRARFDNDPGAFVDFCSNPANLPEMRKLGLAVPEPVVDVPPDKPAA